MRNNKLEALPPGIGNLETLKNAAPVSEDTKVEGTNIIVYFVIHE